MFGLGFTEILLILVVAIVFLGPERLPKVAVDIAKFFKSFKSTVTEAKESINRELDVESIKQSASEYRERLDLAKSELESATKIEPIEELKEMRDELKSQGDEIKRESVSFKKDINREGEKDV